MTNVVQGGELDVSNLFWCCWIGDVQDFQAGQRAGGDMPGKQRLDALPVLQYQHAPARQFLDARLHDEVFAALLIGALLMLSYLALGQLLHNSAVLGGWKK